MASASTAWPLSTSKALPTTPSQLGLVPTHSHSGDFPFLESTSVTSPAHHSPLLPPTTSQATQYGLTGPLRPRPDPSHHTRHRPGCTPCRGPDTEPPYPLQGQSPTAPLFGHYPGHPHHPPQPLWPLLSSPKAHTSRTALVPTSARTRPPPEHNCAWDQTRWTKLPTPRG